MNKKIISFVLFIIICSFNIVFAGDDADAYFYDTHHIDGISSNPKVCHIMQLYDDTQATCVKRGTEFYKCTECNVTISRATTTYPEWHENLSKEYFFSSIGHWKICQDCGAVVDAEAHQVGGKCFCGYDEYVNHKHTFERVYESFPTCTEPGEYYLECSCGKANGHYFDRPLGHNFAVTVIEEGNCHNPGTVLKTCLTCGENKVEPYVTKLFEDAREDVRGKDNNSHSVICSKCKQVLYTEPHSLEQKWDATYHWDECVKCKKVLNKSKHNFGWKDSFEATFDSEGYDLYMCTECSAWKSINTFPKLKNDLYSCDHQYTLKYNDLGHWEECIFCGNQINSSGHNMKFDHTKQPNCGKAGETVYICTTCDYSTGTSIPPTGNHYFVTENDKTYHWKECKKCGTIEKKEKHEFGIKDKIQATTEHEGYDLYECRVCGEFQERNIIPKLNKACTNHKFVTLYNDIGHWKQCSVCGLDKDYEDHNMKLDHQTSPKCGDAGETVYKCTSCEYTRGNSIPPSTQHDYKEFYDNSVHWQECKKCGKITDKVKHKMEIKDSFEATTEQKGYDLYKCTECLYMEHRNEIPQLKEECVDHKYVYKYDDSVHWKVCSACGKQTGSGAHAYKEDHTTAPTCGKAGESVYKCVCGKTQGNSLPPTGRHDYTTKFDNNNHWKECKVCGNKKDIAKHEYTKDHTTQPTCGNAGEDVYKCVCGKTQGNSIPPTGNHKYGSWTTSKAATCLGTGTEIRTCSTCGKKETRVIAAKGHDCSWKTTKVASCTSSGKQEYVCSRCGVCTQSKTISALGHNWSNNKCTRCGAQKPSGGGGGGPVNVIK